MLNNMQDNTQNTDQANEGGESLTINASAYNLKDLQEGDKCTLKITGTVQTVNNDGTVEIAPDSIEQTDINPAQRAMEKMMGGKKKPMPNSNSAMQPDDGGDY